MITESVVRVILRCSRCNTPFTDDEYDDHAPCLWSQQVLNGTFRPGMGWRDDISGWLRIGDRVLCGGCWDRGPNNTVVEGPPLPAADAARIDREQAGYARSGQ